MRHARCLRCDYDLAGIPADGACPECGQAVMTSQLLADRNRLGRDDGASVWIVLCRAGLFAHGAMLLYAMTFAFPGWLALPGSFGDGSTPVVVAVTISGWTALAGWWAMLIALRGDLKAGHHGGGQRWVWAFWLLAPLLDTGVRMWSVSTWLGPAPQPNLRLAAMGVPMVAALANVHVLHRLARAEGSARRGARRLLLALVGLALAIAVGLLSELTGWPWLGAGPVLGQAEGIILLAHALFLGAVVRRLLAIAPGVGGRGDVDVVPGLRRPETLA